MVSCVFNNENLIDMKIQIENLKAQMRGRELNIHQKADALIEFNKLLDYVEELEQLAIPAVVGRSEQLVAFCRWYNQAIPSYETTEEEIVESYLRESN